MKVAELEGEALAEWVARAAGYPVQKDSGTLTVELPFNPWVASFGPHGFRPDLNWSQGGPLLDRFEVCIGRGESSEYEVIREPFDGDSPRPGRRIDRRYAIARLFGREDKHQGDTALIAGCRAIVASVYGAEVPDQQQEG